MQPRPFQLRAEAAPLRAESRALLPYFTQVFPEMWKVGWKFIYPFEKSTAVTGPVFTKLPLAWQILLNAPPTHFHENPKKKLVAVITLQRGGRPEERLWY
jgi:hypothetical protein